MEEPLFKFYRTLDEIFSFCWNENGYGKINGRPDKSLWSNTLPPEIRHVKFWEQIYHEPGNIGIYASHDPFVELYIFVHYPIANKNLYGIQKFYGPAAVSEVYNYAKQCGIELKLTPTK